MQTRSKTNPNPNPMDQISRYDTKNPPEESDEIKAAVREEANRMYGNPRSPSNNGSDIGGRKSRRKNRNKKRRTRRYRKKRTNRRR